MSEGQIVSSDFIISIAVFLIALAIVIPVYLNMSQDMSERRFFEDLQTRLIFSTDAILKTQGLPSDWNYTNVTRLGLADRSGRINVTKIKNLMKLSPQSAKNMLGLGGLQFNITFWQSNYTLMTGAAASPAAYIFSSEHQMLNKISGSGLAWDMYNAGPDAAIGDYIHNFSGQAAGLFDNMTKPGAYKTIIVEKTGLSQMQINISALIDFVHTGGILIIIGDEQLASTQFQMHESVSINSSGTTRDGNLIDAPIGSIVSFNNTKHYFYAAAGDNELHAIIESNLNPAGAFVCYWNFGFGRIYYIDDIAGTVQGMRLIDSLNLIGQKAAYSSGAMQNQMVETVTVVYNSETNSLGKMIMVVGV